MAFQGNRLERTLTGGGTSGTNMGYRRAETVEPRLGYRSVETVEPRMGYRTEETVEPRMGYRSVETVEPRMALMRRDEIMPYTRPIGQQYWPERPLALIGEPRTSMSPMTMSGQEVQDIFAQRAQEQAPFQQALMNALQTIMLSPLNWFR